MLGMLWAATDIDNHAGFELVTPPPAADVGSNLGYEGWQPEESSSLINSLSLDVLSAGFKIAGDVPVVLVNEPIFIAEGRNHLLRYNAFYPRWAYDAYRQFMVKWTEKEVQPFLDYWDALPPTGFSDQNFHRNSFGEERFSELLAPAIKKLVCSQ
jgi:hypothetical protein